jgi:hypothetical protein
VPLERRPQECSSPSAISTTSSSAVVPGIITVCTVAGLSALTVAPKAAPWPIWPREWLPQQRTVESASTAQVWLMPAAMSVAVVIPGTSVALLRGVVLPRPSWPLPFWPQQ